MANMDFTKTFQFTGNGDNTIYTYTGTNFSGEFVITWNNGKDSIEYPLDDAKRFFNRGIWLVVPSLQELYNIEADKLHEQAAKVDSAWRLVQAESVSLQASRQKAIEDKRIETDGLLDDLLSAQDAFDKADGELAEMLRNEPF